ncbi:MAG TPA: hypothetical protein VHQ92_13460 [Pseudolabrys sp.]|nr:hypothetical protein [Pseudolabrys sp.]
MIVSPVRSATPHSAIASMVAFVAFSTAERAAASLSFNLYGMVKLSFRAKFVVNVASDLHVSTIAENLVNRFCAFFI